jgi:hypothetical protein
VTQDIPERVDASHPKVVNPRHLRQRRDKPSGGVARRNDWAATRLAGLFGIAWTVWVFMFYGFLGAVFTRQQVTLLYWSNWVQLWALPVMVYVGNRIQRSSDAQSDAMTAALSHIATVEDQNAKLLARNTELTQAVHDLLAGKS